MLEENREAERSTYEPARPRDCVNPFIGTEPVDLPPPTGLAAKWWWPKPQVGNTHPGACRPMGTVSATAYTGGYPTGYGRYGKSLEGKPVPFIDRMLVSGFTHFQPSGVGAIRKYYNYCRVTPLTAEIGGLGALGTAWEVLDEQASPGYYACRLDKSGIRAEITVTPRGAVHRYTFPKSERASLAVDFSHGGIHIEDGQTIPLRAEFRLLGTRTAEACVTMEGLPIRAAVEVHGFGPADFESSLWVAGEPLTGEREKSYDYIRESNYQPFGVVFSGPTEEGQVVEVHVAFSFRSRQQAWRSLSGGARDFDSARTVTESCWDEKLGRIDVSGGTETERRVFYSALYHSLIKPCEANDESPFWPWDGPFYFDFSTMWDMYKTQLPLVLSLFPQHGADLINSMLTVVEMEGNFPIGYRLARGYDRFAHQASALAHVVIADAFNRGLEGIDWDRAVTMMWKDAGRAYGEAFLQDGVVHPITHTLDLAYGCYCTAQVAQSIGDDATATKMMRLAGRWSNAYDDNGLLRESTYYEGTLWNYSFRLLHDMAGRIALHGGDEKFVADLDRFFGFGAPDVSIPGRQPSAEEMAEGYALGRFEGLNNEPDMEVPYAYVYAGRHDRTCEIVRAGMAQMYGDSPGGMVGNDDSGAMSSWYVWNAIGLFPVAGQNVYLIGSPIFTRSQLRLGNGSIFTIEASETSAERKYVASATLNGQPLQRPYLRWQDIAAGATLHLEMTAKRTAWTTERPPSVSVSEC
ncbi:glycoside hydrolase domain-containing protein [Rosistilla oblonga]|uniref:glycoside hydrolase domain-containing protein n=1 Tax=Rosistilla oblonga TaxID=2527990 RepID=UPI003A970920